jgi:hypothetical protein
VRFFNWQILLALALVALSIVLYVIHFAIFRDLHHIFIYLLGDIAFIPIEVLLVTLVIHQLLSRREKRAMLQKMNMVIGAFFTEVGTELLKKLSQLDSNVDTIRTQLVPTGNWSEQRFREASRPVKEYTSALECTREDLAELRDFLGEKEGFVLRLLENPNLLEHDTFTDLLWAVSHAAEELSYRKHLREIPDTDRAHLIGDVQRAYKLLIAEWFDYMRHLKNHYPYLYSLAVRTNPFDTEAQPEVS